MKKWLLLALLYTNLTFALLPPLWESASQIQAILSSHELKNYLQSAEVIESIEKSPGGYLITTNHSKLQANISAKPQNMPGPASYQVQFIHVD